MHQRLPLMTVGAEGLQVTPQHWTVLVKRGMQNSQIILGRWQWPPAPQAPWSSSKEPEKPMEALRRNTVAEEEI